LANCGTSNYHAFISPRLPLPAIPDCGGRLFEVHPAYGMKPRALRAVAVFLFHPQRQLLDFFFFTYDFFYFSGELVAQ